MNELEKDLSIDTQRLDAEWTKLPLLYFRYREEMDYVDTLIKKEKLRLDCEIAKADAEARLTPKVILLVEKPTETQIKNYVESKPGIVEIKEKIIDLTKRQKLFASAVSGLEMKRDALKNLVQIMNSEYFTTRNNEEVQQAVNPELEISKRNLRREVKMRLNKEKGE